MNRAPFSHLTSGGSVHYTTECWLKPVQKKTPIYINRLLTLMKEPLQCSDVSLPSSQRALFTSLSDKLSRGCGFVNVRLISYCSLTQQLCPVRMRWNSKHVVDDYLWCKKTVVSKHLSLNHLSNWWIWSLCSSEHQTYTRGTVNEN
jgi:hypothetical protein